MKKTLFALALATAGVFAVPAAFAQSAPSQNAGWFVNGNVGNAWVDHGHYDDNTTGYAINGGYRWTLSPNVALGAEVGYNDLGNVHADSIFNGGPLVQEGKSELHGWTAGANARFQVAPKWYLSARGGLYSWEGHGVSNDVVPFRKSLSDTSWYAGAGAGYDFTDKFSMGVNFDHYDASSDNVDLSTNMVSVSAEYRF